MMVNPVFVDNVPPAKSDARAYLVYRVSGINTLRTTDFQGTWTVFAADVRGWFWRDASDTTSPDNGTTIIVGPNGERWKLIITEGGGIFINAAGDTAGRDLYDSETPPFAYYDTEQALLFVKNSATPGDWSDGIDITGPAGPQGPAGTITIGDVTTVGPSDPAAVTNVGTSTNAVLDFDIPKGDKGDKGDDGDPGIQGNTGPTGPNTGLDYAFSTGTSGDPGSGNVATNTGNFSGTVTSIRISETGRNGEALAAVIASWGTSTNPGNLGTIRLFTVADRTEWIEATVTAITDNGAYQTLTVTKLGGNSAPSATDIMSVFFARTGDQGSAGAGTGDVVGPSSATDNAVARWDSTTGKLLQNSNATLSDVGLLHLLGGSSGGIRLTDNTNTNGYIIRANASDVNNFGLVFELQDGTDLVSIHRSSGVTALRPMANDDATLGTAALSWSDLFLAIGGVINWGNGDVTATHASNLLTFAGGRFDFTYDNGDTMRVISTQETANNNVLVVESSRPTPAANDQWYMSFVSKDSAGNRTEYGRIATQSTTITDGGEQSRILFATMSSGTLATRLQLTATLLAPWADDVMALGAGTATYAGLFLGSARTINWGNGNVVLTHSTGVLNLSAGELRVAGNRVLDGGVENQNISGGAEITVKTLGTITTGTVTVDAGDCPWQSYTNNGAHALAATIGSGKAGWCNLVITNGASAGIIDVTDFPLGVEGDDFTTTNTHVFDCAIKVGPGVKRLIVKAMQ